MGRWHSPGQSWVIAWGGDGGGGQLLLRMKLSLSPSWERPSMSPRAGEALVGSTSCLLVVLEGDCQAGAMLVVLCPRRSPGSQVI